MNILSWIKEKLLGWMNHVNDIACKISKVIDVLNRLKGFLPLHMLVNLYNTMILPHIIYCIVVWGKFASIYCKEFIYYKNVQFVLE